MDVRYCHGRCWTEETSDRFDDDNLVADDCSRAAPKCSNRAELACHSDRHQCVDGQSLASQRGIAIDPAGRILAA